MKSQEIQLAKFSGYDLAIKVKQEFNSYGQECFVCYERLTFKNGLVMTQCKCVSPLFIAKLTLEEAVSLYKARYEGKELEVAQDMYLEYLRAA